MTERKKLTKAERQAVYDKMEGHCAYCGCEISLQTMRVDHIVPLRKGGPDTMDNMWPACRSCNHYKRGNTLEGWRKMLEATPETLERDCYTYRQAVRFGTVTPTPKKITFYFERESSQ